MDPGRHLMDTVEYLTQHDAIGLATQVETAPDNDEVQ